MKKLLLLIISLSLFASSCTKEDTETYDNSKIVGSWAETIIEDDYEYVSSTSMLIWTFYANNTATERITLEMNGITMVDKTLHFSYEYKGSTIKLTSESGNISEYEISVSGNTMRLGNQKDGYFNLKKM
jgi:hypothetical protein